ncbi:MAG: hypothetical protein AD742_06935 [Methylibium sp. NZG]|nr:MAG: hypothetical protein AD742_06935 [Methylibium sp. NZG]
MKRTCRVFISHSANRAEEPATQAFLDAVIARLQAAPGLEALADQKDLQGGDEWLQRLYAWMGLCDAAVIVLSPRAVVRENSSWVPRESSLLLWRKALDPRFVVIPVLVGGLQPAQLAGNPFIADLRLADLQFAGGLSDDAKIDAIVAALQARLAAGVARLVFDPVRVHVQDCLQRFAPDDSVTATLAQHFGAEVWQPYAVPRQNLSLKMVRAAAQADAVDAVIADVTLGSQGDARLGARLFEALYPMRLPADSACALLTLLRRQEGQGAVLVNTNDTWAVRMLLRAATGLPKDDLLRTWQLVELPDGWGDDDQNEITRYLAAELAEAALGTGGWELLSEHPEPAVRLAEQLSALAEQLLEARRETGAPIVVCARYTQRWTELAGSLAARFPTAVFLFWTGDTLPPAQAASAECAPLEPACAGGADRRWQINYRRKLKQLGGTGP